MALGKAVIATSIGAEGIHYTNGENIMIADTPGEFLEAVKWLYQNPEERTKMGANAKALIEKEHNTNKIIEGLVAFYWEIL